MIDRRKFLHGVLSLFAGPAIVRSGLIMPIRQVILPPTAALYFGELNLDEGRDIAYWLARGADLTKPPVYGVAKGVTIFSPAAATRH